MGDQIYHLNSGRIFEVRTSDFTLTRTVNVGIDNNDMSYQNGKLVIMSIEARGRNSILTGYAECGATTCYIIDAETMETEYILSVPPGFHNFSFTIPGGVYIMGGFNEPICDGVGFGLINVNTGQVDHWYISDPDPINNPKPEGGGWAMTVDEKDNILYSTLFCLKSGGQTHYRFGIIDLNTNEYSDWYVTPFRVYTSILFDHTSGKLYLTAPLDDAIVVLEPPGYNNPPLIPPVADFSYNPTQGPGLLTVVFENSSYDEDGDIVRIECDWNGEQQVIEGNPVTFEHVFTLPGDNPFTLTVVDDDNLTDTWVGLVYVE